MAESVGEEKPESPQSRAREKISEGDSGNRAKSSSPIPSPGSDNGRRGRSRTRTQAALHSEEITNRKGYHSLMSSFGKVFHVEKRWKLIRELGSGAYGFVISAADEISGEPVAIKMVTRALEKVALAKRVLREITLLRHFAHENITGLIDVDCTPDLSEIYIFMEVRGLRSSALFRLMLNVSDLHQIIKSGQPLTNEHVQYFVYQVLRGMKYVHSASVVHRDLKPGNLLVNADCELKICDFGLSRGFNSAPDENPTMMTEYVATRWYRAPEIMLVYKAYNTPIDVWAIGCIMAELLVGKPLFKGKDVLYSSLDSYVDQLNKILDVLGSPDDAVVSRIASPKAQAYMRSLPYKKKVPLEKLISTADPQAVDLLTKLLMFDPAERITVTEALEHPWLSAYHDESDEPPCPTKFERWREIEDLETLPQFREAIWNEIQDYRKEVRSVYFDVEETVDRSPSIRRPREALSPPPIEEAESAAEASPPLTEPSGTVSPGELDKEQIRDLTSPETDTLTAPPESSTATNTPAPTTGSLPLPERTAERRTQMADPVYTYVRRSSFMQPSRTSSTYSQFRNRHSVAYPPESRNSLERAAGVGYAAGAGGESSIAFPTQEYVVPARSRTASMFGDGTATRRLLRTLSTVSIYESGEGLAGGLADIAPIGKYIVERDEALPSEMPQELESPPQPQPQPRTPSSSKSQQSQSERSGRDKARFHIQE
ncbi:kinase-like domain-containing protein [Trametes punicea]|nr:kinase-like domain-containing protein [Trametes punicea]